jgi:hypothetical protein
MNAEWFAGGSGGGFFTMLVEARNFCLDLFG